MKITLTDAGKRFNRDWIFRHLSYEFIGGTHYAITGPNGSGKSTLLQVIAGATANSEGTLRYDLDLENMPSSTPIAGDLIYSYISITAPYLEVIEEMNLIEFLRFHQAFKSFLPTATIDSIMSIMGLREAAHKQIRYFSSGMKQRVKLAQGIFSDSPIVLLDEPCTNLDGEGIELYLQLVRDYCSRRLLIISSNDKQEYTFCQERINMLQYK